MSMSPIKRKILEHMLLNDKPAKATQISKESGNEFPAAMMHLLDLTRKGFAASPEKGQYLITEKGKKFLGIPETTKENAKTILAHVTKEKAFHFYTDLEKPLNIYAHSLKEFEEKIQKVNAESLEFHVCRGDFENWFTSLGDEELTKKMALLREKKLCGEELRRKLYDIVESRCAALSALT